MARYLITGIAGFIGSTLAHTLVDQGHEVSGIDNLSVIIRASAFTPEVEKDILGKIWARLEPDDVSVERNLALVMLVGEGMRHAVGIAARACTAFAREKINLEMINQGSSEVSMMFGIAESDMRAAVCTLYDEFFAVETATVVSSE